MPPAFCGARKSEAYKSVSSPFPINGKIIAEQAPSGNVARTAQEAQSARKSPQRKAGTARVLAQRLFGLRPAPR
jgi:hypothetical protein